ncbi:MAG: hypothetical protein JJT94_15145 [Bernardetiaceae bacterium]|nr:hypothetical protein [Bernardetiaceae bacterium]
MSKKSKEDKILEELRRRVFERDEELKKQQDTEDIRASTREALADMTALDNREVDNMYRQIAAEMHAKEQKKQKQITIIAIAVLIIGAVAAWYALKPPPAKPLIVLLSEDFSNADSSIFPIIDKREYQRRVIDGAYEFTTFDKKQDWCYWKSINRKSIKIPNDFVFEGLAEVKGERAGMFGFMCVQDNDHFYSLVLNDKNRAGTSYRKDKKWISNDWTSGSLPISQGASEIYRWRIEVAGRQMTWAVNGEKISTISLPQGFSINHIAMRNCQGASVLFDDLSIKDKAGNVIFKEDFSNPDEVYSAFNDIDEVFLRIKPKDSVLVFNKNEGDNTCESIYTMLPNTDKFYKNWQVSVKAQWIESKDKKFHFGLALVTTDAKTYQIFLNPDGESIYRALSTSQSTFTSPTKRTNYTSDGKKAFTLTLRIEGNEILGLVENQVILKRTLPDDTVFSEAQLVVCNTQIVHFDDFEVRNLYQEE